MREWEVKSFRFTLDQVLEISMLYAENRRSISKTFGACAYKGLSFDAFPDGFHSADNMVFLVEMIEDIHRIARHERPVGPLYFENNQGWIDAILETVKP